MKSQLYRNVSEAVIDLHERGFVEDFHLAPGHVLWVQRKILLKPDDFLIVESHLVQTVMRKGSFVIIHGLTTSFFCSKGILIIQSVSGGN